MPSKNIILCHRPPRKKNMKIHNMLLIWSIKHWFMCMVEKYFGLDAVIRECLGLVICEKTCCHCIVEMLSLDWRLLKGNERRCRGKWVIFISLPQRAASSEENPKAQNIQVIRTKGYFLIQNFNVKLLTNPKLGKEKRKLALLPRSTQKTTMREIN